MYVEVRFVFWRMRAPEKSNEHGHTLNRTKTCTVSSQFTLDLHGTRLGTSWWLLFVKIKEKITTGRFFLFFLCTFFYTDGCFCSTGGWYHSYGRKECRLLSIASGCFYGASAPEENRVAQKMHAQVEEDTRVRLMDEVFQTEGRRPQRCFLKTNHCRVLPVFDPLDPKKSP